LRLAPETDLSGPGGALLRAGRISEPAGAAAGLPPALRRNVAGTPAATATTLDSAHGRLYTGTFKSGGRFAAYVFAAAAGDVALICEGATPDTVAACADVIGDSRVGGRVLPAEPDSVVTASLRRALSPLAKTRDAAGSALASSDLTTRAGGAAKIAGADHAAAMAIRKIDAGPRRTAVLKNLATATAAEASGLDALGSAIHRRDRAAYRRARAGVRKAEASMKDSLAALKRAGYGSKGASLPVLSLTPQIASSLPRAKKAVPSSSGASTTSSGSSSSSTPSYRYGGGGTGTGSGGNSSTPRTNSGGNTIPVTPGHYDG
jgi:hypothetical protein